MKVNRNKDNINKRERRGGGGRGEEKKRVIKTHINFLTNHHPQPDSHSRQAHTVQEYSAEGAQVPA